jgi:cytochrome c
MLPRPVSPIAARFSWIRRLRGRGPGVNLRFDLALMIGLGLAVSLSGQGLQAHPSQAEPVEYPFVASFDRFYAPEDDEDHLAAGGLLLLGEFNCTACHSVPQAWQERFPAKPKLSLEGVGSRLGEDDLWLFIRSPQHRKKGTLMPGMFAGADRDPAIVEALTTYLSSLKKEVPKFPPGDVERGRQLYHTVGCVACHEPAALEDYKPVEAPPGLDIEKPGLPSVPILLADKYDLQALAGFLKDPLSIRHSGRMPATELTDQEAADIALYLHLKREPSDATERRLLALPPQTAEEGRKHYVAQRCTACHETGPEAKGDLATLAAAAPPPPPALAAVRPDQGCLSLEKKAGVPDYDMSEFQRRAVLLALKKIQSPPPAPLTALQQVDAFFMKMNCYACHEWRGTGGLEEPRAQYLTVHEPAAHSLGEIGMLPPKLDHVGRKLTDEWLAKLLWEGGGGVRPYMTSRMPKFGKSNSEGLIPALKEASKRETPVAMDTSGLLKHHRSELGRVLMGVGAGGLGCVSCHGMKDRKSLGVPVVNLTQTVHRLQPEYFKELLINPQVTQPGTLMPPLFMGRKKADLEIEQLWTYLKEIDQSRLPEGLLQTGDYEVKPEQGPRPVVFRTFLDGAGMQAVAVGNPGGVHVAFDSLEVRWALAWRGRFLDAMSTWEERAMTPAKPLGEPVLKLPLHMPLAVLEKGDAAWPETFGTAQGYEFKGYRMEKDGTPVMLYQVNSVAGAAPLMVEDRLKPSADGKMLVRTLTVREKAAKGAKASEAGPAEQVTTQVKAGRWYFQGLAPGAKPVVVELKDGRAVVEETFSL